MPATSFRNFFLLMMISLLASSSSEAELITFTLDNVFTDRGGHMTGEFNWSYNSGDFANGVGEFTSLDVPHTNHGLEDLIVTIETTQIEITLDGSFHDDGVDVSLKLLEPFSPFSSASIDLAPTASKYSIGGNGFLDGVFLSGAVSPASVPEPASAGLLIPLAIILFYRRKCRDRGITPVD